MKDATTKFSKNDMELDGWMDGEDDEDTLDGEVGRIGEECWTDVIIEVWELGIWMKKLVVKLALYVLWSCQV